MSRNFKKIATLLGCILVVVGIVSGASALDYSYWPLWPAPSYFPQPPKVIVHEDEEGRTFEIVTDANSTEPMTFFTIGRDIMAWGDRMPMIAGIMVGSGEEYYFQAEEQLPEQAWASWMELVDVGVQPDPETRSPDLPSSASIYLSLPTGRRSAGNLTIGDLEIASIIPEFKDLWYDSNSDDEPDKENQAFDETRNGNWVTFLEQYEFLEGLEFASLKPADPTEEPESLFIADGGHSAPVVVWTDNVWLSPMPGWESFYETLTYDIYGGALTFFATNDGKVRAFSVGNDGDNKFDELWSLLPSPAMAVSPYHEYWKMSAEITEEPRLVALDGPILIHDIEDANGWKRVLFGSMGQGSFLKFKPKEIWDPAIPDVPEEFPPSDLRGSLFGFYAIDVTDPEDPQPFWSVSVGNWNDKDDKTQKAIWKDGQYFTYSSTEESFLSPTTNTSLPSKYASFENLKMSVSRPVVGYTYDNVSRKWHFILLGITSQGKYEAYDIDATTGECIEQYQLGDVFEFVGSDGNTYPNDVVKPSRIAAVAMWPDEENYPEGTFTNTPLLGEVYMFLSNGTLYKWDLQNGEDPQLLLTLTGGQDGEIAVPLQDFDATFLYVEKDKEYHRFIALVSAFGKEGNPANIMETDHYGLVVIDITKLEEKALPQSVTMGDSAFGHTDTVIAVTDYLDFTYISLRAADEGAIEIEGEPKKSSHWKAAYPSSSPVFYDGKVILVTRGYWDKAHGTSQNIDTWSRTFAVDPIADTVQKIDIRHVTHLGGALIDDQAILYLHTDSGVESQDLSLFGLDPLGDEGPGGEDEYEFGDEGVIYWRTRR
jgi:hypothetical protein